MKITIRRGYKVLCVDRSSDVGTLRYRKGKWTEPEKFYGPLCVFTDLKRAVNYGGRSNVWVCEYVPSGAPGVWCCEWYTDLEDLPRGKALADAVKIIRRIE